jgi:hypothetical protein
MFGFTFSPWLLLGAVLALIGVFAAGDIHGHRAEANAWKATLAGQQAEAMAKLEAANAATAARERVIAALKDKVEGDYVAGKTAVDAAYTAGVRAGGVFVDRRATCRPGRDHGVPGDSAAAAGAAAAAAGCELSAETTAALRDLAHDADIAALMARAGRDYAIGLQTKP